MWGHLWDATHSKYANYGNFAWIEYFGKAKYQWNPLVMTCSSGFSMGVVGQRPELAAPERTDPCCYV